MTKYILASGSPRRIDMMRAHGLNPLIFPADVDETLPPGLGMEEAVKFLAEKKARAAEEKSLRAGVSGFGDILIAADTVVYKDGIMGKPSCRQDAFDMLTKIKNTNHYVATGVAIIKVGEAYENIFCDVTEVFCKDYSDDEINAYLDTEEPYDKAGAYAIQGLFAKHIDHYEGDFNTVVGFPWDRIAAVLKML